MSNAPETLQYTKEHEWLSQSGDVVTMGITDFAQSALGDIVYVQLPKVGDSVQAGAICGEVESTKSVSEIYSPVTGSVTEVNSALVSNPELLNSDPYGAGWIAKITLTSAPDSLLSAAEYTALTA
jgi:glycine cleavage system H protein